MDEFEADPRGPERAGLRGIIRPCRGVRQAVERWVNRTESIRRANEHVSDCRGNLNALSRRWSTERPNATVAGVTDSRQ